MCAVVAGPAGQESHDELGTLSFAGTTITGDDDGLTSAVGSHVESGIFRNSKNVWFQTSITPFVVGVFGYRVGSINRKLMERVDSYQREARISVD